MQLLTIEVFTNSSVCSLHWQLPYCFKKLALWNRFSKVCFFFIPKLPKRCYRI